MFCPVLHRSARWYMNEKMSHVKYVNSLCPAIQRTAYNSRNFMPYSYWMVCGFFNTPHWTYKHVRYSHHPKRLESLTIHNIVDKKFHGNNTIKHWKGITCQLYFLCHYKTTSYTECTEPQMLGRGRHSILNRKFIITLFLYWLTLSSSAIYPSWQDKN